MRFMSILAMAILAIFCLPVSATIINIPDDYLTIQQGINASTDGDTVLVQPGTYVENINFNGHNIVLGSLFLTTGDTIYIGQTIVDGNNNGRVVTFENDESAEAKLIGFTIQNGYTSSGAGIRCYYASPQILNNRIINNIASSFGGGMQCYGSSSLIAGNFIDNNSSDSNGGGISCAYGGNTVITDNIISHNSARTRGGGGIYCYSTSPLISNNVIDSNTVQGSSASGHGGGICCFTNASPTIENNVISNNIINGGPTNAHGGGIDCVTNCNPQIINNIIIGNQSLNTEGYGGAIKAQSSNPVIKYNFISGNIADSAAGGIICNATSAEAEIAYNVIVGNRSNGYCGGLGCGFNSSAVVYNNVVYGNTANRGAGFVCALGATPTLLNNIFWADTALIEADEIYIESGNPVIAYCDIQGGWGNPQDSIINADPMFVDAENGDFHLLAGSPCIDAGCPDSPLDPDSTRCDIGAFYFDQTPQGIGELLILPENIQLNQNYPNPFNASTVIKYELPQQSQITINIYDILGRKVRTLKDGLQPAGYHQVIWHARDLSSGMYFYKLQTGDYIETRSMMLLK